MRRRERHGRQELAPFEHAARSVRLGEVDVDEAHDEHGAWEVVRPAGVEDLEEGVGGSERWGGVGGAVGVRGGAEGGVGGACEEDAGAGLAGAGARAGLVVVGGLLAGDVEEGVEAGPALGGEEIEVGGEGREGVDEVGRGGGGRAGKARWG